MELEKLIKHAVDAEAEAQLIKIFTSWNAAFWDELDWSRIKLLSIRDTLEAREHDLALAQDAECLMCPNFVKHVRSFQAR